MNRVFRIDERLEAMTKPALQTAKGIVLNEYDCLVVCAGFEERSIGFLRDIANTGSKFKVIVIEYLPVCPANRISEVLLLCQQTESEVRRLIYDRKSPAGFGECLLQAVGRNSQRLFIDVSGMSRLLIVQSLVALYAQKDSWQNSWIIYSEAESYPPSIDEVEIAISNCDEDPTFAALFLSSGVFDVTIVPELSPVSLGANQSRLVVFPSFNCDQLPALRAELQPSRFVFIHGLPPNPENSWRRNAISRLNQIDESGSDDNHSISTFDYRETLDCLLSIYAKYSVRDRLLISPTGSKMQTVAVALFRAFLDDIQIVYPTPREFRSPNEYTTGINAIYALPLNAFGEV